MYDWYSILSLCSVMRFVITNYRVNEYLIWLSRLRATCLRPLHILALLSLHLFNILRNCRPTLNYFCCWFLLKYSKYVVWMFTVYRDCRCLSAYCSNWMLSCQLFVFKQTCKEYLLLIAFVIRDAVRHIFRSILIGAVRRTEPVQ